jgi:hypothetical protein
MASVATWCEKLSPLMRRMVVIVSIPLLIGLAWAIIVLPVQLAYRAQLDWRSDTIATLAQARGSQAQGEALSQQLKALPAEPIWNKFYNVAMPGAASSQLQADVGGVLNSVHASVQSLTPLRATEVDGLTTIGLRVSAAMTVDQLKNFLAGLASHTHYLRAERLRVNAPQSQVPDQNAMLTVTVEIYGVEKLRSDKNVPAGAAAVQMNREA